MRNLICDLAVGACQKYLSQDWAQISFISYEYCPNNCFLNTSALAVEESLTLIGLNSLTFEKQTTKFSSANFQKMLSPSYFILRIQRLEGKQCISR